MTCIPPYFSSLLLYLILKMSFKTPVSAIAIRPLTASNLFVRTTRRAYSYFPPTRRRPCLLQQSRPNCLLIGERTLSTTPWRRLADVNDSFNPREQERESDEVDVCIVGGGMSCGGSPSKHAEVLQDLPVSVRPFASNRSPPKPETRTSGCYSSRKQAS